MFNPLDLAELTRDVVCKNNQRKYYRFRASRFYGGIATADCVGLLPEMRLLLVMEHNCKRGLRSLPLFEEVAEKLISIAKSRRKTNSA